MMWQPPDKLTMTNCTLKELVSNRMCSSLSWPVMFLQNPEVIHQVLYRDLKPENCLLDDETCRNMGLDAGPAVQL